MSSSRYSVCLTPDPTLRGLVSTSAILILLAGWFIIANLSALIMYRCCGAVAWFFLIAWQLSRARRGWERVEAIRVSQGPLVEVCDESGDWAGAELLDGSLVGARMAWLRFRLADRTVCVEPFRAASERCNKWRRLQVIWRHVGAN